MTLSWWLFALKAFGAVSSAAFGALGVGATTRHANGRLTRHGRIAFCGIAVSLGISLTAMIIENRNGSAEALVQSTLEDQKTKAVLYDKLHTRNPALDVTFTISGETLREIEREYFDRVTKAFHRQLKCPSSNQGLRLLEEEEEGDTSCKGELNFTIHDPLAPDVETERKAAALLHDIVITIATRESDTLEELGRDALNVSFRSTDLLSHARFTYRGNQPISYSETPQKFEHYTLIVTITDAQLPPDYLEKQSFDNLTQISGKWLWLFGQSNMLRNRVTSTYQAAVSVLDFRLRFPTNHNIPRDAGISLNFFGSRNSFLSCGFDVDSSGFAYSIFRIPPGAQAFVAPVSLPEEYERCDPAHQSS